jgi:ABC-type sugar transport system ATPase subunit
MRGVCKSFRGAQALVSADLELQRGEVHALVGENGAGKSTLIKILTGIHAPDAGQILVDGVRVEIADARNALDLGISVIYQEFDLAPNLSVTDNLMLGREPEGRSLLIRKRQRHEMAMQRLQRVGLVVDPDTLVAELGVAERQLVAIARALNRDVRILVLDEPTSALGAEEVNRLLGLLRTLEADGVSVIFVSHKLDEVFDIADRVTVLRDGQTVGTRDAATTRVGEVIRMMVGREVSGMYDKPASERGKQLLEVRDLGRRGSFHDVDLNLAGGEVLGVYGLRGAGAERIARALFGLEPADRGTCRVNGRQVAIRSPRVAIRHGLALVPADRKASGLFPNLDTGENLTIAVLAELGRFGLRNPAAERRATLGLIERLGIRTTGPRQPVTELSGGNQQKVLLARWLLSRPHILVLCEPTAGVDMGARADIYAAVNRLAAAGMGVILVTSDMLELLGLSDRVVVVAEGTSVAEFERAEASEAAIMEAIQVRR